MAPTGACCYPLVADRKLVVAVLTTAVLTTMVVSISSSLIGRTFHEPNRPEQKDNETIVYSAAMAHCVDNIILDYDFQGIIETLKGMECKPRLEKVSTKDIILKKFGPTDERNDWIFYPPVLPVKKCNDINGFCFGSKWGEENGTCQALSKVNASYTVRYHPKHDELPFMKKMYKEMSLTVEMDEKCGCFPENEGGEARERQGEGEEKAKRSVR